MNEKYLRQLVFKGQKGKNLNEAAERVIGDHIEHLLRLGELAPMEQSPEDLVPTGEDD